MTFLNLFLVLSAFIIAGIVWWYLHNTNQAKHTLADFILENPELTALAAYTFDENGEMAADEFGLFHNADQPFVMASTMKIVVLAAYADAVANGELDPGEQVSVADWERYYLPMTDGGAHSISLKSLGLAAGTHGFAENQAATVSFEDLARVMIHYSENASTDYLIAWLGAEKMAATMVNAGLAHHTPVLMTLGPALAAFNPENSSFSVEPLRALVAEISQGNIQTMNHWVDMYLNDLERRAAHIAFIASMDLSALGGEAGWAYQTTVSQLFPRGTAREYAKMMAKIASGKLISPLTSAIMQKILESVPSDWPLRLLFHERFGAKDGTTAGVLTLASYAVPKRGPLKKHARVVVILTSQLPPTTWAEQVQYQGHYLLSIDLAQAKGTFEKLRESGKETK